MGVAVDSLQLKTPPPAGAPTPEEEEPAQRFVVRQVDVSSSFLLSSLEFSDTKVYEP